MYLKFDFVVLPMLPIMVLEIEIRLLLNHQYQFQIFLNFYLWYVAISQAINSTAAFQQYMIDFACKQFNLKDVIKCSLGLTKADLEIFEFLLKNNGQYNTDVISKKVKVEKIISILSGSYVSEAKHTINTAGTTTKPTVSDDLEDFSSDDSDDLDFFGDDED